MQEVFYEETALTQNEAPAKRKYYVAKIFMVVSYVFAVLWGILSFTFIIDVKHLLSSLIFALIPLAMFIASGIVLGKFKDKFYVDYDGEATPKILDIKSKLVALLNTKKELLKN